MPIKLVESQNDVVFSTGWTAAHDKFAQKSKVVDDKGKAISSSYAYRRFSLVAIAKTPYSTSERFGRILLAIFASLLTLGFACISKKIQHLFSKEYRHIRFIAPFKTSAPDGSNNKSEPSTKKIGAPEKSQPIDIRSADPIASAIAFNLSRRNLMDDGLKQNLCYEFISRCQYLHLLNFSPEQFQEIIDLMISLSENCSLNLNGIPDNLQYLFHGHEKYSIDEFLTALKIVSKEILASQNNNADLMWSLERLPLEAKKFMLEHWEHIKDHIASNLLYAYGDVFSTNNPQEQKYATALALTEMVTDGFFHSAPKDRYDRPLNTKSYQVGAMADVLKKCISLEELNHRVEVYRKLTTYSLFPKQSWTLFAIEPTKWDFFVDMPPEAELFFPESFRCDHTLDAKLAQLEEIITLAKQLPTECRADFVRIQETAFPLGDLNYIYNLPVLFDSIKSLALSMSTVNAEEKADLYKCISDFFPKMHKFPIQFCIQQFTEIFSNIIELPKDLAKDIACIQHLIVSNCHNSYNFNPYDLFETIKSAASIFRPMSEEQKSQFLNNCAKVFFSPIANVAKEKCYTPLESAEVVKDFLVHTIFGCQEFDLGEFLKIIDCQLNPIFNELAVSSEVRLQIYQKLAAEVMLWAGASSYQDFKLLCRFATIMLKKCPKACSYLWKNDLEQVWRALPRGEQLKSTIDALENIEIQKLSTFSDKLQSLNIIFDASKDMTVAFEVVESVSKKLKSNPKPYTYNLATYCQQLNKNMHEGFYSATPEQRQQYLELMLAFNDIFEDYDLSLAIRTGMIKRLSFEEALLTLKILTNDKIAVHCRYRRNKPANPLVKMDKMITMPLEGKIFLFEHLERLSSLIKKDLLIAFHSLFSAEISLEQAQTTALALLDLLEKNILNRSSKFFQTLTSGEHKYQVQILAGILINCSSSQEMQQKVTFFEKLIQSKFIKNGWDLLELDSDRWSLLANLPVHTEQYLNHVTIFLQDNCELIELTREMAEPFRKYLGLALTKWQGGMDDKLSAKDCIDICQTLKLLPIFQQKIMLKILESPIETSAHKLAKAIVKMAALLEAGWYKMPIDMLCLIFSKCL